MLCKRALELEGEHLDRLHLDTDRRQDSEVETKSQDGMTAEDEKAEDHHAVYSANQDTGKRSDENTTMMSEVRHVQNLKVAANFLRDWLAEAAGGSPENQGKTI